MWNENARGRRWRDVATQKRRVRDMEKESSCLSKRDVWNWSTFQINRSRYGKKQTCCSLLCIWSRVQKNIFDLGNSENWIFYRPNLIDVHISKTNRDAVSVPWRTVALNSASQECKRCQLREMADSVSIGFPATSICWKTFPAITSKMKSTRTWPSWCFCLRCNSYWN